MLDTRLKLVMPIKPDTVLFFSARRSARKERASIILITVGAVFFLILLILAVLFMARLLMAKSTHSTACESAALTAARDLSRIVVNDPYYGFISLSDSPPIGKATLAQDGEPVPVLGINTITASARLISLIAVNLDDPNLSEFALNEAEQARRASERLSLVLQQAVRKNGSPVYDVNGQEVRLFDDAQDAFLSNMQSTSRGLRPVLAKFKIELGSQSGVVDTLARLPQPQNLANVPSVQQIKGNYCAFVNIPVGKSNFSFVGLAERPALVTSQTFVLGEGRQLSSVVRVSATVQLPGLSSSASTQEQSPAAFLPTLGVTSVACALPPANRNVVPAAVMILDFPHGLPQRIASLRSFLCDAQLNTSRLELYSAINGDFPVDKSASLVKSNMAEGDRNPSVTRVFARALCDWLRTSPNRVKIDSLLSAIDTEFSSLPEIKKHTTMPPLCFQIDGNGDVNISCMRSLPFLCQTILEGESLAYSDNVLSDNSTQWEISIKDLVTNKVVSKKHAGQPMTGNPVNWCELPAFGGSVEKAARERRGGRFLGLACLGRAGEVEGDGKGIAVERVDFRRADGHELSCQPRKSFYSGGLAVYLQLSQQTHEVE